MRLLLVLLIVAGAGCAKKLPDPDPALVAELRAGCVATFDSMGMAADARPSTRAIDDQAVLLAMQCDLKLLPHIRSGAYADTDLVRDANVLTHRLATQQAELKPPQLLVWLRDHGAALSLEQKLLLHALSRQLEREGHLEKPPNEQR